MYTVDIVHLKDLAEWAKVISKDLKSGDVIALSGELGAGKTTISQFIINNLSGKNEFVTSPTFNIVQTYEASNSNIIWHFDLYRLKSESEVWDIGIEDAFMTGISIIEWPEIIKNLLPVHTIFIDIDFTEDESTRKLTVTSKLGTSGQDVL